MERFPTKALFNPLAYPTDTSLTIASMIDGGTRRSVPSLRIAFSHGGGAFPFLLPRYNHQWKRRLERGGAAAGTRRAGPDAAPPRSPGEYARRFYYDHAALSIGAPFAT